MEDDLPPPPMLMANVRRMILREELDEVEPPLLPPVPHRVRLDRPYAPYSTLANRLPSPLPGERPSFAYNPAPSPLPVPDPSWYSRDKSWYSEAMNLSGTDAYNRARASVSPQGYAHGAAMFPAEGTSSRGSRIVAPVPNDAGVLRRLRRLGLLDSTASAADATPSPTTSDEEGAASDEEGAAGEERVEGYETDMTDDMGVSFDQVPLSRRQYPSQYAFGEKKRLNEIDLHVLKFAKKMAKKGTIRMMWDERARGRTLRGIDKATKNFRKTRTYARNVIKKEIVKESFHIPITHKLQIEEIMRLVSETEDRYSTARMIAVLESLLFLSPVLEKERPGRTGWTESSTEPALVDLTAKLEETLEEILDESGLTAFCGGDDYQPAFGARARPGEYDIKHQVSMGIDRVHEHAKDKLSERLQENPLEVMSLLESFFSELIWFVKGVAMFATDFRSAKARGSGASSFRDKIDDFVSNDCLYDFGPEESRRKRRDVEFLMYD